MADDTPDVTITDLSGSRAQMVQRLQVGVFGLLAMILLIGLASIFIQRAREVEAGVVPEAASTVSPQASTSAASDPLADAGVVPELPASSAPQAVESDAPPVAAP
ncbi:hypothetical protein [Tsuneonella sp. HG222]